MPWSMPGTSTEVNPCLSVNLLKADVNTDSFEDGPVCSPCLHRPPLTVPMKLGWVHA